MSDDKHSARCMCGAVVIEATGPHKHTEYCHCKWCQQSSGSAFISWIIFPKDKVKVTRGELAHYHSSPDCKRGFCRDCGSTMSFQSPENFDLALGVMDNPEDFPADQHIWTKSQIHHVNLVDDLPRYNDGDD
ncbi:GFA family protein [Emcibacter sp.]|uniref:GFA family protein n=1 Tax=Emcibacter sp. TaxID=1979954 RepID=UPI003A8E3FD6